MRNVQFLGNIKASVAGTGLAGLTLKSPVVQPFVRWFSTLLGIITTLPDYAYGSRKKPSITVVPNHRQCLIEWTNTSSRHARRLSFTLSFPYGGCPTELKAYYQASVWQPGGYVTLDEGPLPTLESILYSENSVLNALWTWLQGARLSPRLTASFDDTKQLLENARKLNSMLHSSKQLFDDPKAIEEFETAVAIMEKIIQQMKKNVR